MVWLVVWPGKLAIYLHLYPFIGIWLCYLYSCFFFNIHLQIYVYNNHRYMFLSIYYHPFRIRYLLIYLDPFFLNIGVYPSALTYTVIIGAYSTNSKHAGVSFSAVRVAEGLRCCFCHGPSMGSSPQWVVDVKRVDVLWPNKMICDVW